MGFEEDTESRSIAATPREELDDVLKDWLVHDWQPLAPDDVGGEGTYVTRAAKFIEKGSVRLA